jgi:uncharacterized UPF0146 family protein
MKKMFCLLLVFWLSLLISHCAGPIEQPTGSVKGVVKDSDSQPIEGARVVVDTTNLQAITDSRGYYQLTSVPAGQRTLIASKSGYVSKSKVVNVGAGQTVTVDFKLASATSTGTVQGTVWDNNAQPIQDATVAVQGTELQTTTDSDGQYQITNVPAGQRTLIASKSGYVSETKVVNVGAGQIVKVDFTLQTQGAQQVVWQKTFGGSDDDRARSVQETIDGGYIVAGYTWSSSEWEDVYILKLDANGNKLWEKTFGGSDNDGAWFIQQTIDGGYIVAGYTKSYGSGWYNAYLLKLDGAGNKVWEKVFGGSSWDEARSIQQTNDGGYIVAGYTSSFGAGSYDVYVLKLDTSGKEVWSKTFGGSSDDLAWSIQQTNDGGYIVAGYTKSFGAGSEDVYILKLDANGNKLWEKTFGGSYDERAYCIQQTRDGGYIVAGYTSSFGVGNYDVYIIKMDANGNTGAYPTGDE